MNTTSTRYAEILETIDEHLREAFLAMADDQNLLNDLDALAEYASSDWSDYFYGYHDDMEEFARYTLDEYGYLDGLDEYLQNYFDYFSYGRDLELSGEFSMLTDSTGKTFVIRNY